jgi:hypothetical protein
VVFVLLFIITTKKPQINQKPLPNQAIFSPLALFAVFTVHGRTLGCLCGFKFVEKWSEDYTRRRFVDTLEASRQRLCPRISVFTIPIKPEKIPAVQIPSASCETAHLDL